MTKIKFTQIFLYSIRIESNLQEKEKGSKITKNSKVKVAQAFLAPTQLGPAHGFNDLARQAAHDLDGPFSLS
jgi:hypothetical protein